MIPPGSITDKDNVKPSVLGPSASLGMGGQGIMVGQYRVKLLHVMQILHEKYRH